MKAAHIPVILLPLLALALAALGALVAAIIDQVTVRGAYQVWQENETFAAATIALLAAMVAARPVYMQVRAQSVQASLDLLRRTEADTEALIEAQKRLYEVRRAAVALAGALNTQTLARDPGMRGLKSAVDAFMAIPPRHLNALAERPTIASADRIKLATLGCVLVIAQQVAVEILAREEEGVKTQGLVAEEHAFVSTKLAGLFSLSSEITEDLEAQEGVMRARAQELRDAADVFARA
jgi:hypothetical protein